MKISYLLLVISSVITVAPDPFKDLKHTGLHNISYTVFGSDNDKEWFGQEFKWIESVTCLRFKEEPEPDEFDDKLLKIYPHYDFGKEDLLGKYYNTT